MANDRIALFVRLPRKQAAALDHLADATGRRKQQLVSDLLANQLAVDRIDVAKNADRVQHDVLTLEDVAALLRLPSSSVRDRAEHGELPGRRFGTDWRFSRAAVLSWLAQGENAR